jgi:uncharacterized protein (DUF1778 family)
MAKTRRVDLRLDEDEDQLIRQAADIAGMTMSHFMLASAREKAEGILVERALHLLDADAWDRFVARLDEPAVFKPELARLFAEPDIFE